MPKPKATPEAKALKKAEKQRKALELTIQHQRDYLSREIRFGADSFKRHEKQWRSMLLGVSMGHMRSDLELLWHTFEHALDSKDFTISLLMDELQESETQYMQNLKSHVDNIDHIIVLCYDQIGDLWEQSKKIIGDLYKQATFERTDVQVITKEHEDYLKTMLYILEKTKKESGKLIRGDYLSRQDVEWSKLKDISMKFTTDLQNQFDEMWQEAQAFLTTNTGEYAIRKNKFQEANVKDVEAQRHIKIMWTRIHQSYDQIKTLKAHLGDMEGQHSHQIKELTRELRYFETLFTQLKRRVRKERDLDNERLTYLTLLNDNVIKHMEDYKLKGERLLKLSAICRKLETIKEKTMPFPTMDEKDIKMKHSSYSMVNIQMPKNKQRYSFTTPKDDEDIDEVLPYNMNLFWMRVGAAEASRYDISERCQVLRLENDELHQQMAAYCECLNCEPQLRYLYENINKSPFK